MYQLVSNHTVTIAKLLETIGNQQVPPMLRDWLITSAEGLQHTAEMLLETYDVDDVEDYIGKLQLAQQGGLDTLKQFTEQARALPAGPGRSNPAIGGGNPPVPRPGMGPVPAPPGGPVPGGNGAGGGLFPE
jgi:hypothetical protein